MKTQPVSKLGLVAAVLVAALVPSLEAQMSYPPMSGYAPGGYEGQPGYPVGPDGGGSMHYDGSMAGGGPMVDGGQYSGDGCDFYGCGGCGDASGGSCGGPFGGGGMGPGAPFGGYDSMQAGQQHGPLGDGGCCAPRWFDFHAEWMYLRNANIGSDIPFSSDGIQGPTTLSGDDVGLSEQSGFRLTGAYLIGPATSAELTYFGSFNWAASAEARSANNNLYSVVSGFGVLPAGGFAETDQAFLHRLSYSTSLDNGELNFRRRWVSANCLCHSSFLGGLRYVRIADDLRYFTQSNNGQLDYLVGTKNDLVGFQLGFDSLICLTPRFKFGADVKAGVYGNHSEQETLRTATSLQTPLRESFDETHAAFVGEAGLMGLFRITPRATLRGGYTLLYVNGIAQGLDNFNAGSVFTPRVATLDNEGDAFYHGANLGMEFTF
ncbi:MAG: hypothetical protein O3C60_01240 [Planctomycetota bacterium]|nr:hypothetical protein [Planctomycetota bacterium]